MSNLQKIRELTNKLCGQDDPVVSLEKTNCDVTLTVHTGDLISLERRFHFNKPPTDDVLSIIKMVCEATLLSTK